MKRVLVVTCAAALLLPAAFTSSAGAGAGVKGVKDCFKPQNRPHRVVLGCADFSTFINSIHWNKWKPEKGKGEGVLQVSDCTPKCETGTFTQYPVLIKLYKPKVKQCGGQQVNVFRRYQLTYLGEVPTYPGIPDYADDLAEGKLFCIPG